MSERDEPPSPGKYSGAVYWAVPRISSRPARGQRFDHAGDPGGAEIDDLHRPGLVDHDVVGPQVLVQHFLAVKSAQPLGDLFRDAADRLQVGPRVIDHPLGERLSIDELGDDIEEIARPGLQAGFEDMGRCRCAAPPIPPS